MYGTAAIWTLRKLDQKYIKSFEMWCWRKMKKIIWTDHVRNEVLQRVKEERKILQAIKNGGLHSKSFLKHVIDGKIELTE
jgi:hypothetical protein